MLNDWTGSLNGCVFAEASKPRIAGFKVRCAWQKKLMGQ